jgi:hypothetical protein
MRKNGPTNGITITKQSTSTEVVGADQLAQPVTEPSSKRKFVTPSQKSRHRAAGVVVQICLILCAACLALILYPGHWDSADAVQPELRHYVAKVASFLSSSEKPEIVILGSSLMLYPATLCDLQIEGKKPVDNDWYAAIFMPEYTHAKYFEKLLSNQSHLNRHITNLAVASSVMSDHCLLLDSIVDAHKNPQLVICGIAPRDFIDNNQPDLTLTPVHKLLADIRPQLLTAGSSQSPESFFTSKSLQIRRAITCLRQSANRYFCFLANRPDNDNAAKMVPGVLNLPASKAKDMTIYRKVYNPVNDQRMAQQSAYLEQMLQEANANHIKVLLVSMPLTADNAGLLPAAALERYNRTIKEIAAKHQVTLLDLQKSPEFDAADFIDSCHLNARGGAKFYGQLVKAVQGIGTSQR